ncbi:piRNA biogenesis protein EXD1-like [Pecten maximus]|uniref:piRNA biogenesis protein EXD1-like n=1 Tax=Pecten maximus TaxID=6579 RepID=UPI001458FB60|nr:piRNA biogenesis protein EXD1-like [Pecten maximus]
MACKTPELNYMFVDNTTDVPEALAEINRHSLLAVHCKGFKLGSRRSGELTLITVATQTKSFIFDVLTLGQCVFDDGLGAILEDKTKEKLMFNCRRDADNLFHQQKVQLTGVLDLQLLEFMFSKREVPKSEEKSRRSSRTGEVQLLKGFRQCIEMYVKDEVIIEVRLRCQRQVLGDSHVWKTRPLSENLKKYCCVDASALFTLYINLQQDGKDHSRLVIASDRYVDTFRCLPDITQGLCVFNPFLPLDIIPEAGDSFEFPEASTKCIGCLRLFPADEFPKAQLRNKQRFCRVCAEVKSIFSKAFGIDLITQGKTRFVQAKPRR